MTDAAERNKRKRDRYKEWGLKKIEVYIYADDEKTEKAIKAYDKREEARMGEQTR